MAAVDAKRLKKIKSNQNQNQKIFLVQTDGPRGDESRKQRKQTGKVGEEEETGQGRAEGGGSNGESQEREKRARIRETPKARRSNDHRKTGDEKARDQRREAYADPTSKDGPLLLLPLLLPLLLLPLLLPPDPLPLDDDAEALLPELEIVPVADEPLAGR